MSLILILLSQEFAADSLLRDNYSSTTAVLSVTGVLLPSRTVSDRSARTLSVNRRAVNQVTLSITEVHLAAIC